MSYAVDELNSVLHEALYSIWHEHPAIMISGFFLIARDLIEYSHWSYLTL